MLVYESETDTLRQMPENYLIAFHTYGRWICEPDLKADARLVFSVFCLIFDYDYKYGSGEQIIEQIERS